MKIGAVDTQTYTYIPTAMEQMAAAAGLADEPAVILDLSGGDELKSPWDWDGKTYEADKAAKLATAKNPGPSDHSGRLTRRLVAAQFQGEVYAIISEAHKNLAEWQEAALGGDGKAMAAIKRLHKLIRRASRKVGDLNREDILRQKQKRAEKQQQEAIVKQIRAELYRKTAERKRRERDYLRDVHHTGHSPRLPKAISPAELEAKILALATAIGQMPAAPAAEPAPVDAAGGGEAAVAAEGGAIE